MKNAMKAQLTPAPSRHVRLRRRVIPPSAAVTTSFLPEQEIDDPAAPHMVPAATAVFEDGDVGAAGFFERVGQDRQISEAALIVNDLGEFGDGASVPDQPRRLDRSGTERVAEDL